MQVVEWVDYKPVYVEIDDDNTGLFHVFEIRILNYQDPHFKYQCCLTNERECFIGLKNHEGKASGFITR